MTVNMENQVIVMEESRSSIPNNSRNMQIALTTSISSMLLTIIAAMNIWSYFVNSQEPGDMKDIVTVFWFAIAMWNYYCPEGIPTSDHLKLRTVTLSIASDSIPDNHLAVETLLLSVDPFLHRTITDSTEGLFISQYQLDQVDKVIGSTGSDDKVKLIKEQFGYEDEFNYNAELDFDAALSKYFPDGIDVYLDNVGGKMLEAVLNHVNKNARILLCGMISQYNKVWTEREGVRNLLNMVGKEVRIEGFMVKSYLHHFGDFVKDMQGYLQEGKIKPKSKIDIGIESFLESLNSLFSSSNIGKVDFQVKI
ncbi:Zinc-binding dehydrogenase family protein [Trifolium repens]|nr:Zinc-binding dehydrogenase family protein [Trifolium repens]